MNIPPKYEDVVAELEASNKLCDSIERSMKNHRHELGLSNSREAALREELESIKASVDGYDSPEHAAQVADEMGHQCDALQQRLTVAEQLLRRVIACGELTSINHADLEADVCQWLGPVTPAGPVTFGPEYHNLSVSERSAIQVTARIQEVVALKSVAEGDGEGDA